MANRRNVAIVEDGLKVIFGVGEWDPRARTLVAVIVDGLRTTT